MKSGPGRAVWDAARSNKSSAGGNYSKQVYVAARLRRANNNWGNSSYILAELDQTQPNNIGDQVPGTHGPASSFYTSPPQRSRS